MDKVEEGEEKEEDVSKEGSKVSYCRKIADGKGELDVDLVR